MTLKSGQPKGGQSTPHRHASELDGAEARQSGHFCVPWLLAVELQLHFVFPLLDHRMTQAACCKVTGTLNDWPRKSMLHVVRAGKSSSTNMYYYMLFWHISPACNMVPMRREQSRKYTTQ